MFDFGPGELILILILVLVVFGAGKLPEVGSALGKGLRSFKEGMKEEGAADKAKELQRIESNKTP